MSTEFAALALEVVGRTPVVRLLEQSPEARAFVLERIARGGGATNWYVVRTADDLEKLAERLQPGSRVSFYFDDRLTIGAIDDEAHAAILRIAARDSSAVIGVLNDRDIQLTAVDFPSSGGELDEFVSEHKASAFVFGAFPGSENDGRNAVSLTLPDADGIERPHPH